MSAPSDVVTLVPVKPAPAGKSRLVPRLDERGRMVLIEWMLDRVLSALSAARTGLVYVVGADAALEQVAARHACRALPELGDDHNDTIARAMKVAAPARRCLILAADLPLLTSDEIRRVAGGDDFETARLAPSHDGGGTNALLLPAGCAITPQFGPQSRDRHLAAIAGAGYRVREVAARGLAFDVDRPSDLDTLMTAVADDERRYLSQALRPYAHPIAGMPPA